MNRSDKLIRQIDHYLANSAAGIKGLTANFHAGQLIGHVIMRWPAARLVRSDNSWPAVSLQTMELCY